MQLTKEKYNMQFDIVLHKEDNYYLAQISTLRSEIPKVRY